MELKEQLLAELIELRQEIGLVPERLARLSTLSERLGPGTPLDRCQRLVDLVKLIGHPQHREAVAWAFRLTGTKEMGLEARRQSLAEKADGNGRSVSTIERREKKGLDTLAQLVIDYSPEGGAETPASKRIEDLEMVVSLLARLLYSEIHEDESVKHLLAESAKADLAACTPNLASVLWRASNNSDWTLRLIGQLVSEVATSEDGSVKLRKLPPLGETTWNDEPELYQLKLDGPLPIEGDDIDAAVEIGEVSETPEIEAARKS